MAYPLPNRRIESEKMMDNNNSDLKRQELMRGITVFVVLAIMTAVEYFLGTHATPAFFMWIIALVKAGLVVWYFMHIKRVFKEEGGH
jgi:caa(3)-type oxidase subunit IV